MFRKSYHNEEILIEDCVLKKSRAQEVLFKTYSPYLYTICRRYETERILADDCIQDIFLKIFDKIGQYNSSKGSMKSWLTRVAINHAISEIRKQKIKWESLDASELYLEEEESTPSLYVDVTEEQLLSCISALPIGYKTVFNLYVIDGLSHNEIASELGISLSTSKSQLFKARRMLKASVIKKNTVNYG